MPDPLISLVVAGLLMGLSALIFWPEKGLLARWQNNRQITHRILGEDALKHIHKCDIKGRRPTMESIAGSLHIGTNETAVLINELQSQNLVQVVDGDIHLTLQGRDSALHIIRAHRLWERYLAEETGYSEADWHGQAERFEHQLSADELDVLAAQLNYPTHDPHGDPIPSASGEMVAHGGQPLTALPLDAPGQIVHLEDEPPMVYAQLIAEGLHVGMPVRVTEVTAERIRFWANGDEHILAPIFANNISVVALPEAPPQPEVESASLNDLQPGEAAEVLSISPNCRGMERRRFLDLGILPGTIIQAEMHSPGGGTTAYIIRGALIALREQQANYIKIKRQQPEVAV
ncbi:MAG: FeoA domain-containing protein [Ardenticatenaceae bacterium]|nr:FeoA domain-containing protein [Anaerolineales bacterium]MCB8920009.1 FeoA domain-containing protein [Ardenticatenaceae bacterium]MCB8989854.1 FeoA domain-containing protein [Ardenticatenaceae bacterium]